MSAKSLPSGTVTFLFTDIEGSTRLLQELGEDYAELLTGQREMLRRVFSAWEGREVDTQGDAFFYAFPGARKALSAATEALREIARAEWPGGVKLKVRMGLHTGEPIEQSADGYVGMDVHRAARIAHAGHGGQVLLSPTTVSLVEYDLPEGIRLKDLGEFRLKDLHQPLRIMQLVVDGLVAEFPALNAQTVRRHNLPAPISSFVGREEELEEITRLLADPDVRLLTLIGPPGVGKTRLALEAAWRQIDSYEGGVWWVELAPLSTGREILPAIAAVIGAEVSSVDPAEILQNVLNSLERGPSLLVLDNCEHLLGEVGSCMTSLLPWPPHVDYLLTSREPVGMAGEFVLPVDLLDILNCVVPAGESDRLPAALQLFEARATAARGRFTVSADNIALLRKICGELEGLPLAIEIVAARSRAMSLRELANELESRKGSLGYRLRTGSTKGSTLRASIEWSYGLLEPTQRKVMDRLSIFHGSFAVEQAVAVCQGLGLAKEDIREAIHSLIDKSLVTRVLGDYPQPRYLILQLIAEVGRQHLANLGELASTESHYATAFAQLLEQAKPSLAMGDDVPWIERLRLEEPNLLRSFEILVRNGDWKNVVLFAWNSRTYWMHRFHGLATLGEGIRKALTLLGPSDQETYALGRILQGHFAYFSGDYLTIPDIAEEALEVARRTENDSLIAHALHLSIRARDAVDESSDTDSDFKEFTALAEDLGLATLRSDLVAVTSMRAAPVPDREALRGLFDLAEAERHVNGIAFCAQLLAFATLREGDPEQAIDWYGRSQEAWERLGNFAMQSNLAYWTAAVHYSRGEYEIASALLEEATRDARTSGRLPSIQWVEIFKARLSIHAGELETAEMILRSLPETRASLHVDVGYCLAAAELAFAFGDLQTAERTINHVLEADTHSSGAAEKPEFLILQAVLDKWQGNHERALLGYREALQSLKGSYSHQFFLNACRGIVTLFVDLNFLDQANKAYKIAAALEARSGFIVSFPLAQEWSDAASRVGATVGTTSGDEVLITDVTDELELVGELMEELDGVRSEIEGAELSL